MQRLVFAAENVKIALTKAEQDHAARAGASPRSDGDFLDFKFTLTREELERICEPLVERAAGATEDVLTSAGLRRRTSTSWCWWAARRACRRSSRRLADFKRFSSDKDVHPELGVGIGAAMLGRNLARGMTGLLDVVPMPISVMLPGGRTHELIPANTPVPCAKSMSLEGLPPWQAPVPLVLFESLDTTSTDREMFGTVHVGAEWRVGKKVPPELELEVGQDFALKAKLVAPGGMLTSLQIVEQGRRRSETGTSAPSTSSGERLDPPFALSGVEVRRASQPPVDGRLPVLRRARRRWPRTPCTRTSASPKAAKGARLRPASAARCRRASPSSAPGRPTGRTPAAPSARSASR